MTTAAKNLKTGQSIDTDAGPREITSIALHRAPLSGTETVTIQIVGYPHPISLAPTQTINVA